MFNELNIASFNFVNVRSSKITRMKPSESNDAPLQLPRIHIYFILSINLLMLFLLKACN